MQILIPDNLEQSGLAALEGAVGITLNIPEGKVTRDQVLQWVADADGMIIRSATKADAELLSKAPNLKVIVRAGVGVDNIDLEAASQHGVVVMNTPSGNTVATAEMALGMMLALARHIPRAHSALVEGRWERKQWMGSELRGKTLGLVGFGRVGQAVAARAQAFEMNIVAYDPYLFAGFVPPTGVKLVETLKELYAVADYISLHALVTAETYHMINAENIAKMKDGVRIINDARGALIDAQALADAIKSGKVAGAALDVFEQEPPEEGNPLIGLDGVIHTPHLGASTAEAQEAVAVEAAELMLDALVNGKYSSVVNRDVLEKIKS